MCRRISPQLLLQKLGKLIYYSEDNGELYLLNDAGFKKDRCKQGGTDEELQTGLTEGKYKDFRRQSSVGIL